MKDGFLNLIYITFKGNDVLIDSNFGNSFWVGRSVDENIIKGITTQTHNVQMAGWLIPANRNWMVICTGVPVHLFDRIFHNTAILYVRSVLSSIQDISEYIVSEEFSS